MDLTTGRVTLEGRCNMKCSAFSNPMENKIKNTVTSTAADANDCRLSVSTAEAPPVAAAA